MPESGWRLKGRALSLTEPSSWKSGRQRWLQGRTIRCMLGSPLTKLLLAAGSRCTGWHSAEPMTIRAVTRPSPFQFSFGSAQASCRWLPALTPDLPSVIFGTEVADALGLELASGVRKRFRTANSGFEAYGHEIEITALGVVTHSAVYFFGDPMINKNVLGRTGWLDRVRLGLIHHDSKIFLAPYDPT